MAKTKRANHRTGTERSSWTANGAVDEAGADQADRDPEDGPADHATGRNGHSEDVFAGNGVSTPGQNGRPGSNGTPGPKDPGGAAAGGQNGRGQLAATPREGAPGQGRPAGAPGQNGHGPHGPAQNGTGQNGTGQNGPGQNGTGQNPGQNGPAQTGPAQNGTGQSGPRQNGPAQNLPGMPRNGPAQNLPGMAQNGMNGGNGQVRDPQARAGFGTPVRVDEIAVAAMALSEGLHAATQGLPESVASRQFRRDLDEAADTFRTVASELETTAGNLIRLAASEGQACGVTWGICPEHGLSLMSVGETVTCRVLGCYRENEDVVEQCTQPVAYRVVDAVGPALLTCSGHAIACRLHLDGAVITLASDSLELL
ncbi:hypothetical protein ACFPJ1_37900 [Kribbella qitaiheensis]|uniref:hypothetical protein n=1 Tax=Kribbella qitaiheensis TaxID=1544730 RepID=UPI0036115D47